MLYGPMVPPTIGPQNHRGAPGKADSTWGTRFTTKFSRKPAENAPLVTPKGAAKVITEFLSRVEELQYLAATVCCDYHARGGDSDEHRGPVSDLATIQSELQANGLGSISLDKTENDMEAANIAASHLNTTPYDPDPQFAAAMTRRIDWEKYISACGPMNRVRFTATATGTLGIEYRGPDQRDPTAKAEWYRLLKSRFDPLPTLEQVEDGRAFCEHYGQKPILVLMNDVQRNEYRTSKHFGNEDPDPGRISFHAENPRTVTMVPDLDLSEEEAMMGDFILITADLPGGIENIGYAGPHGLLGLDDDEVDDEYIEEAK